MLNYTEVTAKFIGANGSCGYNTNVIYTIRIYNHKELLTVTCDFKKVCDYSSIHTFLKNWTDIQKIK